jgi:hypothetical protein
LFCFIYAVDPIESASHYNARDHSLTESPRRDVGGFSQPGAEYEAYVSLVRIGTRIEETRDAIRVCST